MQPTKQGKVRDIYDLGNYLIFVTSDRLGSIIPDEIPDKGIVLNQMSKFWFDFTENIIPNHMISVDINDMPEEFQSAKFKNRCMIVKKLKMLPIKCIVRGYITGSAWENYQKSRYVCGIKLPDGLLESEKLPEPIYTPTTKAVNGNDEQISFNETVIMLGEELATQVKESSINIYSKCAEYAKTKGILIADTKFEFGIDENGTLTLADEILTPDNSRFWFENEYVVGQNQKSYDKQELRDWIKNNIKPESTSNPHLPRKFISLIIKKYGISYYRLVGKSL